MTNYFGHSAPQQPGSYATQAPRMARSAALLIDFDNVTLGVHTDLGRELKALINSEVFRGKIAVRRAYADWRRFPNYVVPLTEASIDLIFAPAYGSSKKNTTDLRMSADAIELAFTRPEIDTFILLTGDSDFSSTVMKLKEYGKYVIGVGMRESSSDLIIQNCDEYFSYHALTGLTRSKAGEGMREDPWELVARASQKMKATGDAMRTDRLKQVMLSFDPGFNEKELGYSKFSRFVAEAEKKGLLKLHKLPDGQYEILADGTETPAAAAPSPESRQPREARDGRRDRRGDRGRRREPARAEAELPPVVAAEIAPPGVEEAPAAPVEPVEPVEPVQPKTEAPAAARTPVPAGIEPVLALLQRAVQSLSPREGGTVRDGDVKRKMLELDPSFDETKLGYSKFSRFLRFAHDQEAIDVQRLDGGQYEVKLGSRRFVAPGLVEAATPRTAGAVGYPSHAAAPAAPAAAEPAERPAAVSLRGRKRTRGPQPASAGPPPLLPGQVVGTREVGDEDVPLPAAAETAPPEVRPETAAEAQVSTGAVAAEIAAAEAVAETAVAEEAAAATVGAPQPSRLRGRRGRTGAPAVGAPPAPLPGQAVAAPTPETAPVEETVAAEVTAEPVAAEPEEKAPPKRRRGGRSRKRTADEKAEVAASTAGEAVEAAAPAAAEAVAPAAPAAPEITPAFSAEALGLPEDRDKIMNYLTKSYKGVGKKTVEPLLDAFGEDVFRVFAEEPQRVNEVLGERRAVTVLEQWTADYERRQKNAAPVAEAAPQPAGPAAADSSPQAADEAAEAPVAAGEEAAARSRRRGGRGRKRKAEVNAAAAETTEAPPAPEAAPPQEAAEGDQEQAQRRPRSRGRGGRGKSTRGKKAPSPSA
jgi:uncharacterized protein (TIGR00288 family)